MNAKRLLTTIGATLLLTSLVVAQRPGMEPESWSKLKAGDAVPDLVVHDEKGAPVTTRDLLTGHYTVLVFGCLT